MSTLAAREQALHIADQLHALGPVRVARFFGGAGLSVGGRQFGFVMKGDLYLKVDGENRPAFEARHEGPFTYRNGSRTVTVTAYYRVPDEVAAGATDLEAWARDALRAARGGTSAVPR